MEEAPTHVSTSKKRPDASSRPALSIPIDPPVRQVSTVLKLVCTAVVLLGLGACAEGVDSARRDLVTGIAESVQAPAGFEELGPVEITDPDLGQLTRQPGQATQYWDHSGPESAGSVLAAFDPALRRAGYIPIDPSRCDVDELRMTYWHPETGTARLDYTDSGDRSLVLFSDSWGPDAPTEQYGPEVELPACGS